MVNAGVGKDADLAISRGSELEARMLEERSAMRTEVMFRARVAMSLGVEISVFDIEANGEADARLRGQIFAECRRMGRAREAKDGRVALRKHVDREMDFDSLAIACAGHKHPASRWSGHKAEQALLVER